MKFIDITGQQFGQLVVVERAPKRDRRTRWLCKCDCGGTIQVTPEHLKSGHTRSCGCFRHKQLGITSTTHGHSRGGKRTREFAAWCSAKQRCSDPNWTRFDRYGGRGITVCKEWLDDFQSFFEHIGPCAPGLTLDRINNDGNYEPGNVRWVTMKEQANNRS